jgi:hypothetical protein
MKNDVATIRELTVQIGRLLAGKDAPIQSAVLADLLATLLAGHIDPESEENTKAVREEVLTLHLWGVRTLLAAKAKGMGQPW